MSGAAGSLRGAARRSSGGHLQVAAGHASRAARRAIGQWGRGALPWLLPAALLLGWQAGAVAGLIEEDVLPARGLWPPDDRARDAN